LVKLRDDNDVDVPKLSQLLIELGRKISNSLGTSGERATGVLGLMLYRCTAPTAPNPCIYEPSLLLIAQGRKRVDLGKTSYVFGQSRFLLTSIELPIVSRVVTASEEAPYLAFFLKLNIATVRDILNTEEVHVPKASIRTRGMAIGEATIELVRSCSRMMDILDAPQDISFLGKLIQREIIYRRFREHREHAFEQLPRWETRAIGRRRRLRGYVRTMRNLYVWTNWQRLQEWADLRCTTIFVPLRP
jgi:AraC-type transcriptional regulator N-terminus